MKLHLGCGNKLLPGYLNVDLNSKLDITLTLDKAHEAPYMELDILQIDRIFPAESIDEIYSEYVFEHIPSTKLPEFFYSCASVLKRGGELIFTVPDMRMIIDYHLDKKHWKDTNGLWLLEADMFNYFEQYTSHRSVWTTEIGKWYLENEGLFWVKDLAIDLPPRDIGIQFTAVKL